MKELQHFENGTWSTTTTLPEWSDGEDLETWLKRCQYTDFTSLGSEHNGFEIQAWSRSEAPQYLIMFSDNNICPVVTAATLGDALDLIARWAPIVTAGIIGVVAEDVSRLDSLGFVTQVMATVELNSGAASGMASAERLARDRRRQERAVRSAGASE